MLAARVEYIAPWWVAWLHRVPHVGLRLQPVDSTFRPRDESYQEPLRPAPLSPRVLGPRPSRLGTSWAGTTGKMGVKPAEGHGGEGRRGCLRGGEEAERRGGGQRRGRRGICARTRGFRRASCGDAEVRPAVFLLLRLHDALSLGEVWAETDRSLPVRLRSNPPPSPCLQRGSRCQHLYLGPSWKATELGERVDLTLSPRSGYLGSIHQALGEVVPGLSAEAGPPVRGMGWGPASGSFFHRLTRPASWHSPWDRPSGPGPGAPAPATQEDFRRGVWSGPLGLPSYLEEEGLPPMLLNRGSGSKFLAVPKTYLSQVEVKATLRHIHPEPSLLSSSGLSPLLWPFVREAQKPVGPDQKGPSVSPTLLLTLPRQPRLERWGLWAGNDSGHVGSGARLSAQEPDLEPGPALAGGHQSWCHLVSIWLNQEIGRQGDPELLGGPETAFPPPFRILGFAATIGIWGSPSLSRCDERDAPGASPDVSPHPQRRVGLWLRMYPDTWNKARWGRSARASLPCPATGPTQLLRHPTQSRVLQEALDALIPWTSVSLSPSVTQSTAHRPHCPGMIPALSLEQLRASIIRQGLVRTCIQSLLFLGLVAAVGLGLNLVFLAAYLVCVCCSLQNSAVQTKRRHPCCITWTAVVAGLVCCAAVGVGFYGNSEVNDGVYQLIYSLHNANHTFSGIDVLVRSWAAVLGVEYGGWRPGDVNTLQKQVKSPKPREVSSGLWIPCSVTPAGG
ncbi:hypothetical protein J1605_023247 [Eschrichtius robustus]|uniref:Protein tweety homolog n=1 Tax=Eschrichtius robustus TaxID=9764 RepID=A0AB34H2J0_ESCRO|nr:hypothetical protein J1605_023247 [Eschrichtius robustus]